MMKNSLLFLSLFLVLTAPKIIAQSSTNVLLLRSTISSSGPSKFQNRYLSQSIGQESAIGTFSVNGVVLNQGFIQPKSSFILLDKNRKGLIGEIYPNPFENKILLKFNERIETDIQLDLYDVLGKLVYSKKYNEGEDIIVVLNHLPALDYLIKVIANQKVFVSKITKY